MVLRLVFLNIIESFTHSTCPYSSAQLTAHNQIYA